MWRSVSSLYMYRQLMPKGSVVRFEILVHIYHHLVPKGIAPRGTEQGKI